MAVIEKHIERYHSSPTRDVFVNPLENLIDSTKKLFKSTKFDKVNPQLAIQDVLQGKDVFELNENDVDLQLNGLSDDQYSEFLELDPKLKTGNMSDWIKKTHWIKDASVCGIGECQKSIGILQGRAQCYSCGHQVCTDHGRFQMKLSIDAKHDPVNGIWAIVCWRCYTSRKGYNYSLGVCRARTNSFLALRNQKVSQTLMEVNKLEKRLQKVS